MDSRYRHWTKCLGVVSRVISRSTTDFHTDRPVSLVALKILLGLCLLSYSALRQAGMAEREAEDTVNDFGRAAVGERKEEAVSRLM